VCPTVAGPFQSLRFRRSGEHREDTSYSSEQFQDKFSVGSWLEISTTIEVTNLESAGMTSIRVTRQRVTEVSRCNSRDLTNYSRLHKQFAD